MQAQADKLTLQEELEAAKRALESSGNEKQALQGTLDLAQQAASVPDPAIGTGDVPAMMGRRVQFVEVGGGGGQTTRLN